MANVDIIAANGEAARQYAERGWSVIPVKGLAGEDGNDAKRPIGEWMAAKSRRATTADVQHQVWPGVAVLGGSISGGLVIVDVDGPEGEAALAGREMPATPMATTPKGRHCYYRWPDGAGPCPGPQVGLLPKVDIRAEGSYVVAPPTVRVDGGSYEWADFLSPDDLPLAPCPAWLVEMLRAEKPAGNGAAVDPDDVLGGVGEGKRDATLFRYACRLRTQGRSRREAEVLLLEAARNCKPPFPEKEALAKVKAAWDTYAGGVEPADPDDPAAVLAQQAVGYLAKLGDEIGRRAAEHPADPEYILGPIRRAVETVDRKLAEGKPPTARVESLADVYARYGDTRWLWPGWIPLGAMTLLFGRTKQGKSAVGLAIAAAATCQWTAETRWDWPDGMEQPSTPGNALLIDTEAFEGSTAERATNWGLDRDRIKIPEYGDDDPLCLSSPDVKARLTSYIEAANARLTIIDSLSGGHEIDENSSQVRLFLKQIAQAARDTRTAIVLVHHDTKSARDPLERGRQYVAQVHHARGHGSIVASVRSIIAVDHPDGARQANRLHVIAGNLARAPEPVGFTQGEHACPEWCDAPQEPEGLSKTDEAARFLQDYLAQGMRPRTEVEAAAKLRNIDSRVLTGAAERVAMRMSDGQQFCWGLKQRTA